MIPDLTLSALENGFGHFGVASKNNKTRHVDTLGVDVDRKNSTLTCYVKNNEIKEVLEFLNDSGRISFFVGMITHEAYNFKGQFVEVINLSRDNLEASNIYRNKIIDTITNIGMSKEGALSKYGKIPDIGIKFKVDKVFVQTPGPDAGKEIGEQTITMIMEKHLPSLQGMFPSWITSCSKDGEPNTTVISQIWYVDEKHVALSFQFFNKTKRNISENPYAYATISDPSTLKQYNLELKFDHSETEGDLFEEMDMKLQAIASMTGMTGIFKLQAADVYEVISITD